MRPCVPTCAAAIPAIPGRKTRPARRRRDASSRAAPERRDYAAPLTLRSSFSPKWQPRPALLVATWPAPWGYRRDLGPIGYFVLGNGVGGLRNLLIFYPLLGRPGRFMVPMAE